MSIRELWNDLADEIALDQLRAKIGRGEPLTHEEAEELECLEEDERRIIEWGKQRCEEEERSIAAAGGWQSPETSRARSFPTTGCGRQRGALLALTPRRSRRSRPGRLCGPSHSTQR
jgi:hypothetical protein